MYVTFFLYFDVFSVVYFIRKQTVENKELVMVGLLIDSLRNLNPPFQAEEAHGRGPLVANRGSI